jgi:hypothetical protein
MSAATEVISVHRVNVDQPCRRCGQTIQRGRRAALLASVGAVHLRCLLVRHDTEESITMPRPAQPATAPALERPESPAVVDGDDQDPRSVDWWQW